MRLSFIAACRCVLIFDGKILDSCIKNLIYGYLVPNFA